jgi:hypothetical protein
MARKAAAFGHAQSIHLRTSRGLVRLRMADRACLDGESPRGVRQALPATLCYTGFCRSRWLLVLVTLCYSVWCVPSEKIVCHKIGPPWVPMGPHGSPWVPMVPHGPPQGSPTHTPITATATTTLFSWIILLAQARDNSSGHPKTPPLLRSQ